MQTIVGLAVFSDQSARLEILVVQKAHSLQCVFEAFFHLIRDQKKVHEKKIKSFSCLSVCVCVALLQILFFLCSSFLCVFSPSRLYLPEHPPSPTGVFARREKKKPISKETEFRIESHHTSFSLLSSASR